MLYPQEPSPHTIQTSELGLTSLAPKAKPPPTPKVPYAPGSNHDPAERGRKIYAAVATKSPPSATLIIFYISIKIKNKQNSGKHLFNLV